MKSKNKNKQNLHEFFISKKVLGLTLNFKTTYDLFSYKKIDDGTVLLMESTNSLSAKRCLDLGCGYGAIGILFAKLNPKSEVHLVDKDFLAVKYAKMNCQLNNVQNCKVFFGSGFDTLRNEKYDLVLSNLPTHIAKESLKLMIADCKNQLSEKGVFLVVCTTKLRSFITRLIESEFKRSELITTLGGYAVIKSINE